MDNLIVAKFGGTSLADAAQVRKVISIVQADPRRKVVVVSAPGKRSATDIKVTDLLLSYDRFLHSGATTYTGQLGQAINRFRAIEEGLGLESDPEEYLALYGCTGDRLVSRGEYCMGRILAHALGYAFLDPSRFIRFDKDGRLDMLATATERGALAQEAKTGVVIPGFYGTMPDGSIKTFSRGGSDITGSIVASLLSAKVYENWTDVDGTLMADPRVVRKPAKISRMTYAEMRELAYAGAGVLHDEAVFPVRQANIPIHVRNTNKPRQIGTMIVPDTQKVRRKKGSITGIAARKGFTVISIEKAGMNSNIGYGWTILGILRDLKISWEHLPGSIDSLSLVMHDTALVGKFDALYKRIAELGKPDRLTVKGDLSLICTVGLGMARTPGVLAKLATALARSGISIRMIDQGASEISIIVGVEDKDCEKAVRAIYKAFANT